MSDVSRNIVRTLKLTDAIHDAGRTIETLEFAKPRARHLKVIDAAPGAVTQGIRLIASLCDVSEDAIDELAVEDFEAASEIVAGFFSESGSD